MEDWTLTIFTNYLPTYQSTNFPIYQSSNLPAFQSSNLASAKNWTYALLSCSSSKRLAFCSAVATCPARVLKTFRSPSVK